MTTDTTTLTQIYHHIYFLAGFAAYPIAVIALKFIADITEHCVDIWHKPEISQDEIDRFDDRIQKEVFFCE